MARTEKELPGQDEACSRKRSLGGSAMARSAESSRPQKIKSDKMEDRGFFEVLKFRKRPLSAWGIKAEKVGF